MKIIDKRNEIYRKRKIEGKIIPLPSRYAIPIIQNASQEDDEIIQNLWASLIANTTDPNRSMIPKKIFIEILNSLEPLDAKILLFFGNLGRERFIGAYREGFTVNTLAQDLGETSKNIQFSLQNLARLGCIMDVHNPQVLISGSTSFGAKVLNKSTTFQPTPLGFDLIDICNIE